MEYHIALTIDPGLGETEVTWHYAPAGSSSLGASKGSLSTENAIEDLDDTNDWLGRSQYDSDETANAKYNEFRIWLGVLTTEDLELLHDLGPDGLP